MSDLANDPADKLAREIAEASRHGEPGESDEARMALFLPILAPLAAAVAERDRLKAENETLKNLRLEDKAVAGWLREQWDAEIALKIAAREDAKGYAVLFKDVAEQRDAARKELDEARGLLAEAELLIESDFGIAVRIRAFLASVPLAAPAGEPPL